MFDDDDELGSLAAMLGNMGTLVTKLGVGNMTLAGNLAKISGGGGIMGKILGTLNNLGQVGVTYYGNVAAINNAKYGAQQADYGYYPASSNQTPSQTLDKMLPYLAIGGGLIAAAMVMQKSSRKR